MRKSVYRILIALTAIMTALGASGQGALGLTSQADLEFPEQGGPHGIQIPNMDLSVDPGDDFYHFANGAWVERTELLPSESSFGASDEANILVGQTLFEIILDLEGGESSPEGKARLLFEQALDLRERNRDGIDPVLPILEEIQAIDSLAAGYEYQERSFNDDLHGLFIPYAESDPADATMNVAWLAGPFLRLPSEDYYLADDEESVDIRDDWVDITAEMLVELGYDEDEAANAAEAVMAFETAVAAAKTPDEVMRSDPGAWNNPRTIEELEGLLPGFDWSGFLEANGIADSERLVVDDIAYLESLDGLLQDADPRIFQYLYAIELAWRFSPFLTSEIEDLAFLFEGTALLGIDEQPPVEGRALSIVASFLPDILGQAYVEEAFPPSAKAEIEDLVDHLIAAFRIRIEQATWMSDETKAQALAKLDLMSVKVGYPDEWYAYDAVEMDDSLFETILAINRDYNRRDLAKIGTPVDRSEWYMPAFAVNAYYSPNTNEIVFPAGILQPPYFDPEADLASNYGAIGAVIGHEITHGFDLAGSQFDGHGNLVDWWSVEDVTAFEALNEVVEERYSSIEVQPGLNVDGELTVTENVADLGGVQVAYDALMIALEEEGNDDRLWLFSQEQRFFIAFASSWRELVRPEFNELQVAVDEHAPKQVRAVEPLRHMDAFYEAFDIAEGDPEYLPPEDRIVIW